MLDAIISGATWLVQFIAGLLGQSRDQEMKAAGATEVQKDEARKILGQVTDADRIRDSVRNAPAEQLRDDPANLYRD
jgi:hypothetical protein